MININEICHLVPSFIHQANCQTNLHSLYDKWYLAGYASIPKTRPQYSPWMTQSCKILRLTNKRSRLASWSATYYVLAECAEPQRWPKTWWILSLTIDHPPQNFYNRRSALSRVHPKFNKCTNPATLFKIVREKVLISSMQNYSQFSGENKSSEKKLVQSLVSLQ